jgi:hypothetical protein
MAIVERSSNLVQIALLRRHVIYGRKHHGMHLTQPAKVVTVIAVDVPT